MSIITKEEKNKICLNLVKQMHQYIINMGDEDIYDIWIRDGVPDCPSEEDFEDFAYDPTAFTELCTLFGQLCKNEEL